MKKDEWQFFRTESNRISYHKSAWDAEKHIEIIEQCTDLKKLDACSGKLKSSTASSARRISICSISSASGIIPM